MDLSGPIFYRGFALNNAKESLGRLSGCAIERVTYSNVSGIGYTEKRAMGDGNDAGDVFLSARRIQLTGTLYALTRPALYDLKQEMVAAFTPTLAYTEAPHDFGYLPLYWEEPTEKQNLWPTKVRNLYANVRPLALPLFEIVRDRTGGANDRGASLPFQVTVEARDPRIYVDPAVAAFFYPNRDQGGGGAVYNRGDYPAPLNVLLEINGGSARVWRYTGGGSIMEIKIPATANKQIFRYSSALKILTVEEEGVEYLRMDLLDFVAENTHPEIAPGSSDWSWTIGPAGTLLTAPATPVEATVGPDPKNTYPVGSSRIWFSEAYA